MKYCLFLFIALGVSPVFSQDVIVLRKNEQELKCRILALNDSLVTYRLWQSPDTTSYTLKKFEVLSFLMDKRSRKTNPVLKEIDPTDADRDLLAEYKIGSTLPGYVITNDNDTLHGFISIKTVALNQVNINFSDSSGNQTVFTVKDAKGYGYAKIHYDRIKTGYKREVTNGVKSPTGYHFLHLAIDGPSKLYRFYTLRFTKSQMVSYHNEPLYYLGKLKRQFVIVNPAGRQIFTKGRTLKGTLNRIYFEYPKYISQYPVEKTKASELPGIVTGFNSWFETHN